MAKRGVTEEDVDMALRLRIGDPGLGQPGTIWISGHAAGGRILKVCLPTADQDLVITAAWRDYQR